MTPSMTDRPDLAAALCNVCCNARTVKFSRARKFTPRGFDYRNGTCDLKCQACGTITRHALVLAPAEAGGRFEAQELAEAAPAAPVDHFELVRRFGVRVHEVEGLADEALWLPDQTLAFVRAGLDAARLTHHADWLLAEAFTERANEGNAL